MRMENISRPSTDGIDRRHFLRLASLSALAASGLPNLCTAFGAETAMGGSSPAISQIQERIGSLAWRGDLVVVGGTMAGLALAITAARRGIKTLLLESCPFLGTDVSAAWNGHLARGWLADELSALVAPHGGVREGWFDPYITTLACDRVAALRDLTFLLCVTPTRPHRDKAGQLAGVEFVGKSGRQVAAAPVVIDATASQSFSRYAAGTSPLQAKRITRRIYLHGVDVSALSQPFVVPASWNLPFNTLEVQRSLWAGEAVIGFSVEPQHLRGAEPGTSTHHLALDLVIRLHREHPAFAKAILVDIAPLCDIEYISEPVPANLIGTGLHLLTEPSRALAETAWITTFLDHAFDRGKGKSLTPLPPVTSPTGLVVATDELVAAPERRAEAIPLSVAPVTVHPPTDVVVAGCGTGGSFAALAAAQQGARVLVVDMNGIPGGVGTSGKVNSYYRGVKAGMRPAIDTKVNATREDIGKTGDWHPCAKADTLLREMESAHITIETRKRLFGVVKQGRVVTGVLAADEQGYHLYPCRIAIDGTGDGDLAAAAGASFTMGRAKDGVPLFYSYNSVGIKNGSVARTGSFGWADSTDTFDYTRAHVDGRSYFWRQGPFTQDKHYCTHASMLGIRQSRTIKGPVTVTAEDFMDGKTWPDTVCAVSSNFDVGGDFAMESDWLWNWVVLYGLFPYERKGEIPYRTLYPEGVEGMLIACRAYSVEHNLKVLARMQPDIQQLGEVCGIAAALSVQDGVLPSALGTERLRTALKNRNLLPNEQPSLIMDLPCEDLLKELGGKLNGLAMWRLIRKCPKQKIDWNAYVQQQADVNKRFCAAIVAAYRGESHPELTKVLEQSLDTRENEPLLGERSRPRYIVAALALAEAKSPGTSARLQTLLEDESLPATDVLFIYIALSKWGGSEAVSILRGHLKKMDARTNVPDRDKLELAAVRELQSLGCYDESHRAKSRTGLAYFLLRKLAVRLTEEASQSGKV